MSNCIIYYIALALLLSTQAAKCQDLQKKSMEETLISIQQKPEVFSSGFIDVINNGQVNASARFVKLFIGEPGKFSIPLSFYIGTNSTYL